jgi:hypothetical protein
MASTAQDSTAPLRSGEGKKDEDREEDSTCSPTATVLPLMQLMPLHALQLSNNEFRLMKPLGTQLGQLGGPGTS